MKVGDRILIGLHALVTLLLALGLIAVAAFPVWLGAAEWAAVATSTGIGRLALGTAGLLLMAVSIMILLQLPGRQFRGPILLETDHGVIAIYLSALESLVQKAAHSVRQAQDVKGTVICRKDSLEVRLVITVAYDASIPEVATEVQRTIKRQVKHAIGMEPHAITITVKRIADTQRRRIG